MWSKPKANKFCKREVEVLEHYQVMQVWAEMAYQGGKKSKEWQ